MGIRGLSLYVHENFDVFDNYKLKNCNVIIDGKNLAHFLHRECTGINISFGGDYDKYANFVRTYFETLRSCGIKALVVMDGGQPLNGKKFKTAQERAEKQIRRCLSIDPGNQFKDKAFPPMCLQVFVTTLHSMDILVLQTDFEADDEIGALARNLDCIVISGDTDFYVTGVPFVQLHTINYKTVPKKKYLTCQHFNVESFCELTGVIREHLPLLGTLLCNDYVSKEDLGWFHDKLALKNGHSKKRIGIGRARTIQIVISWMAVRRHLTAARIINEVAGKNLPLKRKLQESVDGYTLRNSQLLECIPTITRSVKPENGNAGKETLEYTFDLKEPNICRKSSQYTTTLKMKNGNAFPYWFIQAYRENRIPYMVADILTQGYFFSPPQVECISSVSSYLAAEPIVRLVFSFLWKSCLMDTAVQEVDMEVEPVSKAADPIDELKSLKLKDGGHAIKSIRPNANESIVEGKDGDCDSSGKSDDNKAIGENANKSIIVDEDGNSVSNGKSDTNKSIREFEDGSCCSKEKPNANKSVDMTESDNLNCSAKTVVLMSSKKSKVKGSDDEFISWYMRKKTNLLCKRIQVLKGKVINRLPLLSEVGGMTESERKSIFYQMLRMNCDSKDKDLPLDLELIYNCISYWCSNSKEKLNDCHAMTTLICFFLFYLIDNKIGRVRTWKGFESVETCQAKVLELLEDETYCGGNENAADLLAKISQEECLIAGSRLFKYHHFDKTMNSYKYRRDVVHAFSEYQACVFYLQLFNSLLCSPFPFLSIEFLWGGTFSYNVFIDLSGAEDRASKVTEMLGKGTCLERLYHLLYNKLETTLTFSKAPVNLKDSCSSKRFREDSEQVRKRMKCVEVEEVKDTVKKVKIRKVPSKLLNNPFAGLMMDSGSENDL